MNRRLGRLGHRKPVQANVLRALERAGLLRVSRVGSDLIGEFTREGARGEVGSSLGSRSRCYEPSRGS